MIGIYNMDANEHAKNTTVQNVAGKLLIQSRRRAIKQTNAR